jgi:uncharacterized protein YdhG (YjbR/CyaY superfamily)
MSENMQKNNKTAASNWSDEEKAAMKERAKELKAEKANKGKANDEQAVMDKIAEMPESEKLIAQRLHQMIKEEFPGLYAKTWYGMPAYQLDGKTLVFFQSAHRFGSRYSTLGFSDTAKLDDGAFWPTSFALVELDLKVESEVRDLIRKAIGYDA